jgi:phosphate transport system substrate-binding protein
MIGAAASTGRTLMSRILTAFVVALCLAGCTRTDRTSGGTEGPDGSPQAMGSTTLTVKGSDTMVILGQRWAENYMKANPSITVQVTGGGSGTGIAALINGSADICESSRQMKDKEKADVQAKRGAPAIETSVALDALAIYVNDKSPVHEISLPMLAKIYKGEVTNWKDVGGPAHAIILYGRENNSGTYGFFKEHVLENKDFAPAVQTLAGTSAVVNAVKGDEFGIGYGGIAYLEGIRALKVKKDDAAASIQPSLETAQSGVYPISRFLYFYTAGQPTSTMKKFIDWVVGAEGQKTISDVGYYPLPTKDKGPTGTP